MSVKLKEKTEGEKAGRVVGFETEDHMVVSKNGGVKKVVHRIHGEKLIEKGIGYVEVKGVEIEIAPSSRSTKDVKTK